MANKIIIGVFMLGVFAWQAHAAVNCNATGRFADPADTTCKNYTLCVLSRGTYLSYNYVCPSTSVFNPNTRQCTEATNYVCNVTASLCTADGFIADPSSTNCSSYIQCVSIDGVFTETTLPCPDNTYYNPNTTLCEPDYVCTTFNCTAAGRFANAADSSCKTYFYCVLLNTGVYTQYNYTCPSTSVFNPTSALCTTSYTCTG